MADPVAGERTWTLEGRVGGRAPFAYRTGGDSLAPGERVEVVELSRLRAAEEERDKLVRDVVEALQGTRCPVERGKVHIADFIESRFGVSGVS